MWAGAANPTISSAVSDGTTIVISGTGGTGGAGYTVLTSTDITTSRASWAQLTTGNFDGGGGFTFNDNVTGSQKFYVIRVP